MIIETLKIVFHRDLKRLITDTLIKKRSWRPCV